MTSAAGIGDFTVVLDGLDHPEDVVRGPDDLLYAGGEAGQVYRVDLAAGTVTQLGTTGGALLGIVLDAAGRAYVCDYVRHEVLRVSPDDGRVEVYSTGTPDAPLRTPNGVAFGPDGTLYVTDSGTPGASDGLVLAVDPSGETRILTREPCGYPNGVVLSADGEHLYLAESNPPCVSRVRLRADGTASGYEVVVRMPGSFPDGIAALADGRFVIGCYQPDSLLVVAPDGELTPLAEDPSRMVFNSPANVGFAGERLDRIVVANLGRRHLSAGSAGLRGHPLHYPSL